MTWPRATRNLKHADAGQLTAMLDAAAVLLEHERHISPDVITALCQIREETAAELKARGSISRPARASARAPFCSLGSRSARCHAGIAADFRCGCIRLAVSMTRTLKKLRLCLAAMDR